MPPDPRWISDYTRSVARVVGAGLRMLAVLLIGVGIVGGCLPPTAPAVPPGTRSCVGLPRASCEQVFQEAEARARERGTVVAGVVVRCTTVCTAASGEAERTVTFADGTTEQGGFGWQATEPAPLDRPREPEPSLPVGPTCVGLDLVVCGERALESLDGLGQEVDQVVSIVVVCQPGPCTPTKGEGETTVTFGGGQVRVIGWGYEGSP